MALDRWRRLIPGLWAGWTLCVALLATPAAFATLERHEAGRVVAPMLAQEAYTSLVLGVLLLVLERVAARRGGARQFSVEFGLVLGTLACTVAGYFAIQPLMAAARAGQGAVSFGLSFGQLHAISTAFFGVKAVLILVLAWRASVSRGPSS